MGGACGRDGCKHEVGAWVRWRGKRGGRASSAVALAPTPARTRVQAPQQRARKPVQPGALRGHRLQHVRRRVAPRQRRGHRAALPDQQLADGSERLVAQRGALAPAAAVGCRRAVSGGPVWQVWAGYWKEPAQRVLVSAAAPPPKAVHASQRRGAAPSGEAHLSVRRTASAATSSSSGVGSVVVLGCAHTMVRASMLRPAMHGWQDRRLLGGERWLGGARTPW